MLPAIRYRIPVVIACIGITSLSVWYGWRSDAQPAPIAVAPIVRAPSRSGLPARAVPCVGADVQLLARGATPVLCSSLGCLAVDMETGAVTASTKPEPLPIAGISVRDGSVCTAHACKHLGPQLAAAVAASPEIDATADLAVVIINRTTNLETDGEGVVIHRSTAWNVADDRPLSFSLGHDIVTGDIAVAGKFLAVNWIHHEEGSWSSTSIYDAHGRVTAGDLDGDAKIVEIANSIVVAGSFGNLALIDATTGKVTARDKLATAPVWIYFPELVLLPRERVPGFAVLRRDYPTKVVSLSTFSIVEPYLLALVDKQIPVCAP